MTPRLAYYFLSLFGAAVLSAQAPLTCSVSAASTPMLRSSGSAEAVSDLLLNCTGGVPTALGQAVPPTTITFTSNAAITSKQLDSSLEALMLAEEPSPAIQSLCTGSCTVLGTGNGVGVYNGTPGHANIFPGSQAGANAVSFVAIPLDPPGSNSNRMLRFTNLRVDATSLSPGLPVTFTMTVSGNPSLIVQGGSAVGGMVQSALSVSSSGGQVGPNGLSQFNVSFTEGFASVFKTRTTAVDASTSPPPVNQNNPGQVFPGAESIFYNGALPGSLANAGLADSGTRVLISFSGIPQGVQILPQTTVAIGQSSGVLRLAAVNANGSGAFSPGTAAALSPDANGSIVVVYEVLAADPGSIERADVPFQVIYAPGAPRIDNLSVSAGLAPTGGAVVPRFGGLSTVQISTLGISQKSIPRGSVGVPYTFTFTPSGGVAPFTWAATGLPSGLTLSTSGVLSGTPTLEFNGTINVKVTDASRNSVSTALNLSIVTGFVITTTQVPNATVGVSYNTPILTAGGSGTVTFTLGTSTGTGQSQVPPGLALSSSGVLNGTPIATGTYSFAVMAADSAGHSDMEVFTVVVAPALLLPTPSTLSGGAVGTPYSATIMAQGGTPPYSFSTTNNPPPGLTLSVNGLLSGTPTVGGPFTFTVKVTDAQGVSVSKQFMVTFTAVTGQLQSSPTSLSFSAVAGGDAPPPQTLQITSGSIPTTFAVATDSGSSGSASPRWLSVQTGSATTPTAIQVSVDPSQIMGTSADGRIVLTVPANPQQQALIIPVHVDIGAGSGPQLDVSPSQIRVVTKSATPTAQTQTLLVRNAGSGGAINFTASVVQASPWLSVLPVTGSTAYNTTTPLTVTVNPQGLKPGSYRDSIHVAGGGSSVDVPVSLYVAPTGPVLQLDTLGTRFSTIQGAGTSFTQTVRIFDVGDSGTAVNWTADVLTGAGWVTLTPTTGTSTPTQPGTLTLGLTSSAATLPVGQNWALVRIADPAALASPQFVTVELDVAPASTSAQPQLSDGFLYFSAAAGSAALQTGSFQINTSSVSPVNFLVSATTNSGGLWLTATSSVSSVSTAGPATVKVAVNPAGLNAGIYKGQVNVLEATDLRTKDVTLVVTAAASAAAPEAQAVSREATCGATSIAVTMGALSTSFNVPAGSPTNITAQVNDNCGNAIPNANVVATFSNGETPKPMNNDGVSNVYTATFAPASPLANQAVTITATLAPLTQGKQVLSGSVPASQGAQVSIAAGGVLNNLNPKIGGALAPGEVVAIFGSNLTSQTAQPSAIPLLTTVNNSSILANGTKMPLYFLSSGQVNAELPLELPQTPSAVIVATNNGVLSLPEIVMTTTVDPGVAAPGGPLIAQHADFSLVTPASPAKAGEALVMYLVGMGATNPSGTTGSPAPQALAPTVVQPTVTVDGQAATLYYAGLTPGGIGLYQINFQVPTSATPGNLDVVVMQGTVTANTSKLIVGK